MQQINPNPKQADAPQTDKRRWPLELHHPGVWAVIGLVILGLILLYVLAKHPGQNKPKAPTAQAQISVTDTGFIPQTIQVKPGTQVSWVNNDAKAHEIAADPYPKDDSIPGFSSDIILQTNDSYSFGFAKKGIYHYHDQLNPLKLLGTVVVK
jgi:plastocyanin